MHRFFAEHIENGIAVLSAEDARHAYRVLRLKPGEPVIIFNDSLLNSAVLETVTDAQVTARLTGETEDTEARLHITLYQGVPKADKMDLICQKNTELGVCAIVPVAMSRCVSIISLKDAPKKQERWQRICREAAKQSGRAVVPEVKAPLGWKAFLSALPTHSLVLVPWEDASRFSMRDVWKDYPDAADIAIVIGPEGGMSPEEIAQMNETGAHPITLGKRILRTETAGLVCAAGLFTLYGDMD